MTEGKIYKIIIDPLLTSLRATTSNLVPDNLKIIDIACGTGALAIELSKKSHHVLGVDISKSMIQTANKMKRKLNITNAEFMVLDATQFKEFKTKEFDLATISMAIHQFDTNTGIKILSELSRIAKEILIVDYACPIPNVIYNRFIYFIERLAGKEHFRNFKSYQHFGGIYPYLNQLKIKSLREFKEAKSIFYLVYCSL